MLRLAHRILSEKVHLPDERLPKGRLLNGSANAITELTRMFLKSGKIPSIIADDVANFYGPHEKLEWDRRDDFPNIAPPYMGFFVEWQMPQLFKGEDGLIVSRENSDVLQCGSLFLSIPAEEFVTVAASWAGSREKIPQMWLKAHAQFSPAKWVYRQNLFITSKSLRGGAYCTAAENFIWVDEAGKYAGHASYPGIFEAAGHDDSLAESHIALLAICFMHCGSVKKTDVTDSEGPERKWLNRMKQPEIRYHILDINPMREVLRKEGRMSEQGRPESTP